ncbi:hypothetical protein DTW90_37005 [Neorhizobium sp. P12A]|uniref:alginate lyase family protein n=1 Tax=Neorhizobium sp. P12A TaxID=2268027 RepID=UPI0011EDFB16|nr:alginate lyase family protein [Neorhizobium sp. P12A]KAA0681729.1 hypothetical protein DTW90_37005 [Neorhizobium sp. P12A]
MSLYPTKFRKMSQTSAVILLFVSFFALNGSALGQSRSGNDGPLRYIFDLRAVDSDDAGQQTPRFVCGSNVRPMTDMGHFFSFYKPTSTQSVIDPKAMNAFAHRAWPTWVVMAKLLAAVNAGATSHANRQAAANCITQQLISWAKQDALLGNLDENDLLGRRQAVMISGWTAVGLANAYAFATQASPHSDGADRIISPWFQRLSDRLVSEFAPPAAPRPHQYQWLDDNNNVRDWAGASVGLLSVQLQDRTKFDWAMTILHNALDLAPDDGALPRELGRGRRASHYQNFAMQALSYLVALADANNVALSDLQEKRLEAIARFSAEAYQSPKLVEARTGYAQEDLKPEMVSWIDIILPHIRKRDEALAHELEEIARPLRPLSDTFVALPTTVFFNGTTDKGN